MRTGPTTLDVPAPWENDGVEVASTLSIVADHEPGGVVNTRANPVFLTTTIW
jgi:hypothetical protein